MVHVLSHVLLTSLDIVYTPHGEHVNTAGHSVGNVGTFLISRRDPGPEVTENIEDVAARRN